MKKILSLVLVGIMMISSASVFAVDYERNIEISNNGTLLELTNEPFIENDIIYLPLRELFEKAGLLNDKGSYINWDDGKIEIFAFETVPSNSTTDESINNLTYKYGLEIGKAEYILNPGYEEMYLSKWDITNIKQMADSPVLRDNKTYIPYEYVEYLINKSMQYTKIEIVNGE